MTITNQSQASRMATTSRTKISPFDTAIGENRRGIIRVALHTTLLFQAALELVESRMLIAYRRDDEALGVQEWEGYASDFEALPLGAIAPFYTTVCYQEVDGDLSLTFQKSPYNSLNQTFKG